MRPLRANDAINVKKGGWEKLADTTKRKDTTYYISPTMTGLSVYRGVEGVFEY